MKRSRELCLYAVSAALVAAFTIAGTALAGGGNSGNAKACQKGGWASPNLQDGSGNALPVTFKSQDECVEYGVHNGPLFNPSLIAVPSEVVEDQGIDLFASGFHPNSTGTFTDQVYVGGVPDGSVGLLAVTDASGGFHTTSVFSSTPASACAAGDTGALFTYVDGSGVHASAFVTLDCP
jgi:hypothetical protein